MKPILLAALATTSLLSACAEEGGPADELAGESDSDGDVGKGDTADAFTYFEVTPDIRACSLNADCGGYFVNRAGRAKTTCIDGTSQSRCYVRSLDFSRTLLSDTSTFGTSVREGSPLLMRGDLAFDTGLRAAERLASDAQALLVPAQPMVDVGGGPDCLYAKLTVTNVTATTSSITVSASHALAARLEGVTITATSQHAVSCVDGTAPVTIKLARVDITGMVTDGDITNPIAQASGTLTVEAPAAPSVVLDMLALDTKAALIVAQTTGLALEAASAGTQGATLSVSEVWLPGSTTGTVDGVFVLAKDNGVRCITAPCASIAETRLNANRAAAISSLDLAASGADAATIEAASADVAGGPGVLLVGDRFYTDGGRGKGRSANQFWTKAR